MTRTSALRRGTRAVVALAIAVDALLGLAGVTAGGTLSADASGGRGAGADQSLPFSFD